MDYLKLVEWYMEEYEMDFLTMRKMQIMLLLMIW